MGLTEIEKDLKSLRPEELRQLSLYSWKVFLEKEGLVDVGAECHEEDPNLLGSLDEAIKRADATPGAGVSAEELRSRLGRWTSK